MKFIVSLILVCLCLSACKKDIDVISFSECHQAQNLDSAVIYNKLVGSWKWTKQNCFSSGKTTKADKTVIVSFNGNGSFTEMENAAVTAQGTWGLQREDINYWGLSLSQYSKYLWGRILFCNNEVLFNSSYRDGCDNLFERQ
ncbi:MAG: hypothetical protein AAB221_10135 [Bacteroidota bacterium]